MTTAMDSDVLPKESADVSGPESAAYTVMVQGTTSDAGKSVLVAGLCRVLARRGVAVAPFKPQNMALNSAVTSDGGEIGRAQAVQAQACGLEPQIDMNPVLLKPNSDIGAQVIIHGRPLAEMNARDFHDYKSVAMEAVLASHSRLAQDYRAVVVEGAGSPAEINLRERDIANMGFAEAVDCPVIIVADIDRGGVFAHLIGTLELLSESEQARVAGFVINRFRGDISLLQSGLDWLEVRTGKPVLGVLPYLHGLHLAAEDAVTCEQELENSSAASAPLKVIVPVVSRISNHTDFDALRLHPQVDLQFIGPRQSIPPADLIILPGSKSVRRDIQWLRDHGWEAAIHKHLRYGGKVIGICGGFQMLGESVDDPYGIEGAAGSSAGLALLNFTTYLKLHKQLRRVTGRLNLADAEPVPVEGYEIHMGVSCGPALARPAVTLDDACGDSEDNRDSDANDDAVEGLASGPLHDGVISADNQILGTYLHGLFDNSEACRALLQWAGLEQVQRVDYRERQETDINRLADAIEESLDLSVIFAGLGQGADTYGRLSETVGA